MTLPVPRHLRAALSSCVPAVHRQLLQRPRTWRLRYGGGMHAGPSVGVAAAQLRMAFLWPLARRAVAVRGAGWCGGWRSRRRVRHRPMARLAGRWRHCCCFSAAGRCAFAVLRGAPGIASV